MIHDRSSVRRRSGSRASLRAKRIALGVTVDFQLRYHDGLPELLAERGWEVHLISSPGPWLARYGDAPNIHTHPIAMARSPKLVADLRALLEWVAVLKKIRPAVTLLGTPKAGLVGNMAARFAGVPHRLYELHGLRLEGASGIARVALGVLERLTTLFATRVIAVGPSLATAATRARVVRPEKIAVLGAGSPNGVPVIELAERASDANAIAAVRLRHDIRIDETVIVYVGRLARDKGVDVLLRATRASAACVGPLHVLLVGPVDDEHAASHASGGSVDGHRVTLVGQVQDVAPYLGVGTVFCLPSRREGLPTVVLEAFASRIPVVATRATGIVDLVSHERTGLIGNIDDATTFAENIVRLVDSPELREKLTSAAYSLVASQFESSAVRQRYVEHLEHLAEDPAPSSAGGTGDSTDDIREGPGVWSG
ncbi:glycosyltransferase [Agrococcus sp. TF02-05]|uniref:glycosyltransferase n=1 Tax=Agrococcus sp. TF02-05 TaxID=2815211 RepID=UPI001AA196FB|nr:glycosyltransferase [Agrococcus sp. TF02-05]MBO1769486.1 glycosyltransferase [Agrococcus sp. TF02-05]